MHTTTQIEAFFRAIVREEIERFLSPAPTFYSTERRELYPPGRYSEDERAARRQARDRIKAHPAHERCGSGKSSEWRVSVDTYHAKRIAPVMQLVTSGAKSDDEIARAAIAAAGLRSTRRSA